MVASPLIDHFKEVTKHHPDYTREVAGIEYHDKKLQRLQRVIDDQKNVKRVVIVHQVVVNIWIVLNLLFHSVLEKFLDSLHNIGHIEDFQAIGESHNFQQEKYSEKAVFGHVHEKGDWKERDEILEESGL